MPLLKNWNINGLANAKEEEIYWKKGFSYAISRVSSLLGVSNSWITHSLLKDINYVVYDCKFVYNHARIKCQTYIRKEDLSDWIRKHARFEIQTEVVDLYSYIAPYKDVAREAYEAYKGNLRVQKGESRPIIPNKILEYINDNLLAYGLEQNRYCDRRRDIPWVEIKPFDIFSVEKNLYNAKDANHKHISRETIYRRAFLNGDIRIKISEQITLFVKNDPKTKKKKMPFLVPYNKPIRIEGER